ncbi:hypothetical protein, partial [Klebsiella pneumoniae]|uniref:hypothetical protein n=1 Tax=Klebsiella pneumoniae TaxID=573 RepID=UPI002731EC7A
MKPLIFSIVLLLIASKISAKIKPDGSLTFGIMTANSAIYPAFTLNGGVRIPLAKMFSIAG